MSETLNRSTLASMKRGSRVNLERAMAADGRFGGHIVAGHVDGIGEIIKVAKGETAIWYRISAASEGMRRQCSHRVYIFCRGKFCRTD